MVAQSFVDTWFGLHSNDKEQGVIIHLEKFAITEFSVLIVFSWFSGYALELYWCTKKIQKLVSCSISNVICLSVNLYAFIPSEYYIGIYKY